MLDIHIRKLTEPDLKRLVELRQSETLRLEFKKELHLSSKGEKLEAAKDVSAFANVVGGRIVYGVVEAEDENGVKFASALAPLTDGSLKDKLRDVITGNIEPRPQFRLELVEAGEGGFFLVVEIYSSSGRDLHMVSGHGHNRFYKRVDAGAIPMSEPEIRESYQRIAIGVGALEESIEARIGAWRSSGGGKFESILIIPWYGKKRLTDPRQLEGIHGELTAPLERFWSNRGGESPSWRVTSNGIQLKANETYLGHPDADPEVTISKHGSIELCASTASRLGPPSSHYDTRESILNIHTALCIARKVLDEVAYWGPVRICHKVTLRAKGSDPALVSHPSRNPQFGSSLPTTSGGTSVHEVGECILRQIEPSVEPILCEIFDQFFQRLGREKCPWFHKDQTLRLEYREQLPEIFGSPQQSVGT